VLKRATEGSIARRAWGYRLQARRLLVRSCVVWSVQLACVEAGNGVMTSVSLFDTSAHADESTRLASSWVEDEKLESGLPTPPKITFGEVIAQRKSNGAVRA